MLYANNGSAALLRSNTFVGFDSEPAEIVCPAVFGASGGAFGPSAKAAAGVGKKAGPNGTVLAVRGRKMTQLTSIRSCVGES